MVLLRDRSNKKGRVKIAYCPTGNMLGDFFTKPLQGSVFKNKRKITLNMPDVENTYTEHRSVLGNNTRTVSAKK